MVFSKTQVNAILEGVSNVENSQVVKVHEAFLVEKRTTSEDEMRLISDSLVELGKGVLSNTIVTASEHGLALKAPTFRVYLSLDNHSDLPYVKVTVSRTPTFKFDFKMTFDSRLDSNFREDFLKFLNDLVVQFVLTAIANENIESLNGLLEEVKQEIEESGLTVPFELKFAISERSIDYISNDSLVLGTTVDKMIDIVSANSPLEIFFGDDEGVDYIKQAIKATIIEDWTSSPNPLVFVRKHNKYIIPLVTGDLNTRRTKRVDVLIRNSFTLSFDSLVHRKKAIAHKIDKDDDETYISVYEKHNKDEEPVEILSPVNIKSLAYKG